MSHLRRHEEDTRQLNHSLLLFLELACVPNSPLVRSQPQEQAYRVA